MALFTRKKNGRTNYIAYSCDGYGNYYDTSTTFSIVVRVSPVGECETDTILASNPMTKPFVGVLAHNSSHNFGYTAFQSSGEIKRLTHYIFKELTKYRSDVAFKRSVLLGLALMQPRMSQEFEGKIAHYPDTRSFNDKRLVAMKIGRFIKKLAPEFGDKEIESISNSIRTDLGARKWTVHIGDTPKDFVHAYSHQQAAYEDPRTTDTRKSLACSCMRYEFEDQDTHPASAYASGDFKIVWVEDSGGRIGGRCVVCVADGDWKAGPIYGVCENSINIIESVIAENNGELCKYNQEWTGARLLYIPYPGDSNRCIAPYLDGYESMSIDGDYLVVESDNSGKVSSTYYEGYQYIKDYCECCDCGDEFEEDSMVCVDGDQYCPSCVANSFVECWMTGEFIRRGEEVMANVARRTDTTLVPVCASQAIEIDGVWWVSSSVVTVNGVNYPKNSDKIVFDGWGTWILKEEAVELNGGWFTTAEKVLSGEYGDYELVDGIYVLKEGNSSADSQTPAVSFQPIDGCDCTACQQASGVRTVSYNW